MSEKTILTVFVFLMFSSVAILVYWSGPKFAGWGKARTYLTSGGIAILGLIAAIYSYWITGSIDQRTLFETRLKGNAGAEAGDPVITRKVQFSVEHPATPHKLLISPRLDFAQQASFDLRIGVRLWANNEDYFIDETLVFEPQTEVNIDRYGRRFDHTTWEGRYLHFIPDKTGVHQLQVDLLVTDTPDLYVWIEDPLKSDGVRDFSLR